MVSVPPLNDRVAWAAGFFDGEGCLGIYVMRDGLSRLQVQTSQRVEAPIRIYEEMFGGSVCCTTKGFWQHVVFGPVAAAMLMKLLPHLVVKRDQAELALQFAEMKKTCAKHPDYPSMAQELSSMKRPWLKAVS